MEGAGSRLGRASSRPPPPPSTKLFSGRVKKWKKMWVHVSSPQNKLTRSHIKPSRLSLCRWTPLSEDEQPRRREVRYAPIVVVDCQKRELDEESGDGAKTIEAYHYQSTSFPTFRSDENAIHEKHVIAKVSMRGDTHQESNQGLIARQTSQKSHFDINLFFTPNSDDYNSFDEL